ncbi:MULTISPECIES: LysR substrate-binding domain-containing protein [unclassified Paludibacterium]|uniref:LysR substrate-binding domain-containing protein n=1 Tax=unclassified Paludibacterium TaxID=2618429 RepID=UPI001C05DDF5|nr:LysR substrate-binding domain-containing protein [Paludibacterium sp. B53371]BEV72094.1 LysR substrate-binding domain-containing protein [Paludibacterium sp. THUN1379]
MNITIRQLRALLAVAQEGSIANASEKLCLTRPAVSQTLQELERQFGRKLFHRVSNRLILNSEGKQLLPYIDELIQRINQIENFFTGEFESFKRIKVGTTKTIGNYLLPGILQDYHQTEGGGYPTLFIGSTGDLCNKLQTTELDVAIIERTVQDATLTKRPWIRDEMIVIAPPDSTLGLEGKLQMAELEKQAWVLREQGSGSREQFDFHIGRRLKHPRIALEINATEAIINAVIHGVGLAFVSRIAVTQAVAHGLVRALPMPEFFHREFCIATYSEKYVGPELQALLDYLEHYKDQHNR